MRRLALSLAVLAATLLAGSATAAPAPLAKEKKVAAKRLFAFVYPMSYVIDYRITDCTREGTSVTCGYKVGFYTGESCTGTISVEATGRGFTTKIGGPPCVAPAAPTTVAPSSPTAPTSPGSPTQPGGSVTPTPTPNPTPTPSPSPTPSPAAYPGVGKVQWLLSVYVDGTTVILGDGSQWQIAAASQAALATWTFNDDVTVQLVSGSTYTLTDTDAGGSPVTATYLGTSS